MYGALLFPVVQYMEEHKILYILLNPIISYQAKKSSKIQGIGAGFIPEVLNTEIYDEIITVENELAFETSRLVATEEGILGGISSGAAIYAALKVANKLGKG
jgi:cysteine synthase